MEMSGSSPERWPEFRPTELLKALAAGSVDFVVIGGIAAVVHGSARLTQDLDIMYSKEPANLDALGRVLVQLGGRLRGVTDDVPFVPDERTLGRTTILTLDTKAGPLDLLTDPPGAPRYEQLRQAAGRTSVGGVPVLIASIDHLVAMKVAAGRDKDLLDIEELDEIRRLSS
jgi:predicted nucleotidyltransferase